jgi:ubiquinone/menaquinone biosynthesis C-methylase UbiE
MRSSPPPGKRSLRERVRAARTGRRGFALDAIPPDARAILDIGSGEGWFLAAARVRRRIGVDTDPEILGRARARYPDIEFLEISGARLPFDDAEFDAVVLSEVIEHVGNSHKQAVMDEAMRVLSPGGTFVLTAPHAGLFAWLDPLDFKRRFPRAYRIYQRRTGRVPKTAVEVGHQHVTLAELQRLMDHRVTITRLEYVGPLTPLVDLPYFLAVLLGMSDAVLQLLARLQSWEMSLPAPRPLASGVRLVARRSAQTAPESLPDRAAVEARSRYRPGVGNEFRRPPL